MVFAAKGVSKAQLKRIVEATGQPVSPYRMYETVKREAAHLLRSSMLVGNRGDEVWELFDPIGLVQHVLDKSPDLAAIYSVKLAEHAMPWHIVLGIDEHVPGDKLKARNLRKSMVLYFNFLELGGECATC